MIVAGHKRIEAIANTMEISVEISQVMCWKNTVIESQSER